MKQWLALARRYERVLWIAFIVAIVGLRWPLLKGYYYKMAHVEAPPSTIAWRTDLDSAMAEARRTGRPVLVDFSASWCPPCIAMKHEVWPDPAVERAVVSSYVPVAIDVDHDGGLSDRYGVQTIPTLVVLNARGEIVRQAGYLPVSGVLRFLAGN